MLVSSEIQDLVVKILQLEVRKKHKQKSSEPRKLANQLRSILYDGIYRGQFRVTTFTSYVEILRLKAANEKGKP